MPAKDKKEPLRFRVAPHLVQDLGLNLYTSLPSVLAEFLANAYDAESETAKITLDFDEIVKEKAKLKADHALEVKRAKQLTGKARSKALDAIPPLAERLLPDSVAIVIEDEGLGMSRDDLANKFLIAGRRRREEDKTVRSENSLRVLMGRKGLGKLAGFGVAHRVELTTRRLGEKHATRITLEYEKLLEHRDVSDSPVQEEQLDAGGGFRKSGTRIVLSSLVYESMKKEEGSIQHDIADHFEAIRPEEFRISFNGQTIQPTPRDYAFAYPDPKTGTGKLIDATVPSDEGTDMAIRYRVRFTKTSLPVRQRGVRVYANHRLAAAADPLDVKTGLHGFQNLQYLDAVVEADFIDRNPRHDYIATNRRTLRWEVGHLADLRKFLTAEMEEAIRRYQDVRDAALEKEIEKDHVTRDKIGKRGLPIHRQKVARRVAKVLASQYEEGVGDPEYAKQLDIFLDGLSQGDIIGALGRLANKRKPDFHELVEKISELTAREVADFMRYVEGRLRGIEALEKICSDQSFKKGDNESELHRLFEKNPWLLNPSFNEFVASNVTEATTLAKLAEKMKIGSHVPKSYNPRTIKERHPFETNLRPDLVFLLGGERQGRIVIVELKAPNTPLHIEHLNQLDGYRQDVKTWLKMRGAPHASVRVEGMLIGSMPEVGSKSTKVAPLLSFIEERMPSADSKVVDILQVLSDTKQVHEDIWRVRKALLKAST